MSSFSFTVSPFTAFCSNGDVKERVISAAELPAAAHLLVKGHFQMRNTD